MRLGVRRWWNIHCCLLLSRRLLSSSHFFHFSAVASQPKIECFSALRPRRETKGLGEHVMELRDYNYHVEVIKGTRYPYPYYSLLFLIPSFQLPTTAHPCTHAPLSLSFFGNIQWNTGKLFSLLFPCQTSQLDYHATNHAWKIHLQNTCLKQLIMKNIAKGQNKSCRNGSSFSAWWQLPSCAQVCFHYWYCDFSGLSCPASPCKLCFLENALFVDIYDQNNWKTLDYRDYFFRLMVDELPAFQLDQGQTLSFGHIQTY